MIIHGIYKKIDKIAFSLISPEEIRKMSATKVITADTYDDDGFPIELGLMDTRMGVIEPGLRCKTCGQRVDSCPGHFGHIDLAMPVIHVGFVKRIKDCLRATCKECGHIMVHPDDLKDKLTSHSLQIQTTGGTAVEYSETSKEVVKEASTKSVCPNPECKAEQARITLDKPTTFREDGHKLTPRVVRERLEKIPDKHLPLLGLNPMTARPEWMVLTCLPVPPVTVRPSITLQTGERSEDDLTHKMVDVLRINQRLRENRDTGAPQLIVEDLWELLQYHITTYFDNQTSGIPPARHRSGRPLKTLAQRLKGKEGRFRSNLSGKRVNFSARTVISPDPMLSIRDVGIPEEVARELTIPVRVNSWNLEVVREMVKRGPEPTSPYGYIPGVNYVIRPDGRRVKVTDKNAETVAETIVSGYVIERQLVDYDIALFNRQPSLHRMSMMAHRIRIMDYRTFRFNLAVCPPYNADFDGDEMNLHVVQSEEAQAEAKILMQVPEHILSPRFGGPVIGSIHDHVTGIFMLTYKNPTFTREEVVRLVSRLSKFTIPEPDTDDGMWSGKALFSAIMPEGINLEYKASICQNCKECKGRDCETDAYVVIEDSVLKTGAADAKSVSAFKGKILDLVARDYGADMAAEFLDKATKLALGAIMVTGFTTGIDDEDIPPEATLQISELLIQAKEKVNTLVEAFKNDELEQMPGRSMEETLEVNAMSVLGKARDEAGQIAGKYLGLENSAVVMAKSGARGSMLNLSQMAGSIGQQAVRGERITRGYNGRTLPHFKRDDLGAEAKGFVTSCYKSGLNPTEYFFHSMGGREGLVDTAVRTSRSGYMQRRLINALEDLKVEEDRTVRNTSGTIVQFMYGDDGIDPSRGVEGKAIDLDEAIKEALSSKGVK